MTNIVHCKVPTGLSGSIMDVDQLQSDGPATVLRVKRKRTTPSAPELGAAAHVSQAALSSLYLARHLHSRVPGLCDYAAVVEGLVPKAAKRQAILNHFSQLGFGDSAKPEAAAPPAVFQLVKSSTGLDDLQGDHLVQTSLLNRSDTLTACFGSSVCLILSCCSI